MTIPSAMLAFMSDEERARVLESVMARSADVLGDYMTVLDARLRMFEQRYELPSSELETALASGRLPDTAETSDWLFWVYLRSDLAGQARPHSAQ